MQQFYMILSAVGCERGQPYAFYKDPFKAQTDFDAIHDVYSALTGNRVAFLVAYELMSNGQLVEIAELGAK